MAKTPQQIGQQSVGNPIDTNNTFHYTGTQAVTSGTGFQVSTARDATLYVDVATSSALTIAISGDGTTYTTILNNRTVPVGLQVVRVPAGFYVRLTGTPANFVVTSVLD